MNFRIFYTIHKARLSKYMLNALEIDLSAYLEQDDACLAIDSTGVTREFSASDISPARAEQLACFVDGWLYAKGISRDR